MRNVRNDFLIYHHDYHYQSVLPERRSFTANSGTQAAVLPKGWSSTVNSVLLRMNRYGSFPLLSTPHSLFIIWADLKRSEKIPVSPAWRWGEWIWLSGSSELQWNSPEGLNISSMRVFDQIRDPEIPITIRPPLFSIWTDLKRTEKIPGAPRRGVESGLGLLSPPDFTEIHYRA